MQDILFEYMRNQSEVIIYGAGANGRFLKWVFDTNQVKVHFFSDSNEALWGDVIDGIECISPEKLDEHLEAVLVISPLKNDEIKMMIRKYHFKKVLDWNDVKFLEDKFGDKKNRILQDALSNDIKMRDVLKRNKRFKGIHNGERCFILGNGPSLQKEDLSLLSNEITFTVNQIARNPQFREIHTNYHLWADPRFFKTEMKCKGDYDLLEIIKNLPEDAESFFMYDCMREYIEKFDVDQYIHVNYYATHSLVGKQEEIDFSKFICGAWTVVQYAIRLAIYMGLKEIYLLGCDCTAILGPINARLATYASPSHGYVIDEHERERERLMYMGTPLQAYYLAQIEALNGYREIREYCMQRNISIYNCTQGGLLEEFPRKNLRDICAG